jgi:two-component system response regulator HydG
VLLVSRAAAVIEPVRSIRNALGQLHLEVCADLETAVARLRPDNVALVLAHLAATGEELGTTRLLHEVSAARRPCATVVLADAYREQQAAALFRAGAADYLELPADRDKLAHVVDALTCRYRRAPSVAAPQVQAAPDSSSDDNHLGSLMTQVTRVAPQDTTLLLTGATGTGKTRLARLIHDLSPRRGQPFLVVDCGSLSPTLIESELFGHAKGAFTGADRERPGKLAAAESGTLLLDEVNSLPLALQSKLLRAVDARLFEPVGSNREVPLRARLIAATNVPLEEEVAAGRFRADLFYRLNVVGFFLPPLRERRSTVAPLAHRFLVDLAARNRPDVTGFAADALRALEGYDWPGNVRELRNIIERAVALSEGPVVGLCDLPEAVRAAKGAYKPAPVACDDAAEPVAPSTLHQSKREAELRRIVEALEKHKNNRLRAAAELGISRVGLYKKLHRYGLMESV